MDIFGTRMPFVYGVSCLLHRLLDAVGIKKNRVEEKNSSDLGDGILQS
jgi:hypothetical protein